MRSLIFMGATLGLLAWTRPGVAQQPLAEFLRAAEAGGSLSLREAELSAAATRSEVDEARGRLLPSLSASASYQRNQFEAVAEIPLGFDAEMRPITQRAVITPEDQLEANVTLTVPLLDVSQWSGFFGAEARADAADARTEASFLDARVAVVTAYHALVAARAVRDAAARTLAASEQNLGVVASRAAAGIATEVDHQRAIADLERARQTQAEAELEEILAARQLEVASGLTPSEARVEGEDPLIEEAPLARWVAARAHLPALRAAQHDVRAAELARDAAWQGLLPTIAATASERLTNATGFNGQNAIWTVGVSASWTLDFGRPAALSTRERQLALAQVRAEREAQGVETAILEAYHRVRSRIARARAARAAAVASGRAAEVARARFAAGTGTQLEVSQSERDLFSAEVARIQADADLVVSRLALRLRSGLGPDLGATP